MSAESSSSSSSSSSGTAAAEAPAPAPVAAAAAGAGSSSSAAAPAAAKPSHATSGIVMVAGSMAHAVTGRGGPTSTFDGVAAEGNTLYNFHTFSGLPSNIRAVFSGPTACHYFAISEDGSFYVWGRNEKGQLGLGHTKNVYTPILIPAATFGGSKVLHAACGRNHSLVCTEDGNVYGCGESKLSQTGLGEKDLPVLKWSKAGSISEPIVKVACGGDFSVILGASGRVYAAGTQQDGVCGTGATGEHIVSAGKVAFTPVLKFLQLTGAIATAKIIDIKCGISHGIALADDGNVFSWGAGGYGRCGHGDNKDALFATKIKAFEPDRMRIGSIGIGATASFFVSKVGSMLFMSGITKKTGEANMSPKPCYGLQGWRIRDLASGQTSTIVAAESSLVAYGPSPTSGELGFGIVTKSSTVEKKVDDLEGCHIIGLTAGLACSVIIVDVTSETKEGKEAASRLAAKKWAVYDPSASQKIVDSGAGAKPAAGAGAGAGAAAGAGAGAAAGGAGGEEDDQLSGKKRKAPAGGNAAKKAKK